MSNRRRRILFFTPYATRTGSEMMIYYILKYLDRSRFEPALVTFAKGDLLEDLPADVPVFVAPLQFSFADKLAYHLGFHPTKRALIKISARFKADFWYVNTVMLAEVVKVARDIKMPVVTHIHELSAMYSHVSSSDFELIVKNSQLILGCSETVCKCMAESGAKKVEKLYSFVDLNEITPDAERVKQIRTEWGAGPEDFVWIMSGTTSDRKGFDLIPDIALQFPKGAKIHLVWVGNLSNDGLVYWTKERCKSIDNVKIHLIGAKKHDYYSYLAAADGFMFTSRQEPFGLVMIEAAWLGKPIVSFASGGPNEFISPEIGTLVPNLDIPAFVSSMMAWSSGQNLFDKEKARQKALEFSADKQVKVWHKILDEF
jgi:glycosyltransferase involved in cell wall biosynthesis